MLRFILLLLYAFTAAIIGGIVMNLIMMAYYAIMIAISSDGNPTIDNIVYRISVAIGLAVGIYLMWMSWPKENGKKEPRTIGKSESEPST